MRDQNQEQGEEVEAGQGVEGGDHTLEVDQGVIREGGPDQGLGAQGETEIGHDLIGDPRINQDPGVVQHPNHDQGRCINQNQEIVQSPSHGTDLNQQIELDLKLIKRHHVQNQGEDPSRDPQVDPEADRAHNHDISTAIVILIEKYSKVSRLTTSCEKEGVAIFVHFYIKEKLYRQFCFQKLKMSRRDRGDRDGGRSGGGEGGRGPPPDITKMVSLKVDGLSHRTSIEDLESLFEKYGRIGDVYIPKDYRTKESRGFGFVRFYNK